MPRSVLRPLFALALSAIAAQATAQSYYMVAPNPLGRATSTTAPSPNPAPALSISLAPGSLPDAMLGKDYSQDLSKFLSVTGDAGYKADAANWTLASGTLPDGLSLSSKGVVAGKPTALNQAGATFEVLASYKDKNGRQTYTIKVGEAVLQVVQLAAGGNHTCAVTTAGEVKCWGYNVFGQLGDGTMTQRSTPVAVSGLASGVASIAAGANHSCAVTTVGDAKCWGRNFMGELGDGTTTDKSTPVAVSGLTSEVANIAAGDFHTCAVTTAGGVKCWGLNGYGQLGDGTMTQRSTPVAVSGLASGVASIAAGANHSCAMTIAGGVKCWGYNTQGQLGDGTTTDKTTPVAVSGLTSGVASIAADAYHSCAVTTAGEAKCWGYNSYGQLGDGTMTNKSTPVAVSGLASGVASIAAGHYHVCAVTAEGGAKCWGDNSEGQLGDGTKTNKSTPVAVSGLTSGAASITGGAYHSCAATTAGAVKCWGYNRYGQLGDGTSTNRYKPVNVRDN